MKVQIIYASRTGCTRKLAQAIYEGIQVEEKTIHDLADGMPELDGDIILFGYWGMTGGPDKDTRALLETVKGKTLGFFATLGYYADTRHGFDTMHWGAEHLKDDNEIIGSFICTGAVASALKKGQGKSEGQVPTEQKEIRWEIGASHPTEAECALAAERFRERIFLYQRCKELNIPFQSIL